VEVASLGLAALDLATQKTIDLIIVDIRMPGMNGIQTIRAVRDILVQFGRPAIPEVVLTAYDEPSVREEARRLGVRDFFLKPFEVEPFLAGLKKVMEEAPHPAHAA